MVSRSSDKSGALVKLVDNRDGTESCNCGCGSTYLKEGPIVNICEVCGSLKLTRCFECDPAYSEDGGEGEK